MTDKEHIFGDLKMTQGTSDYFQSDSDFESRLSILKDKIREFFNLKNVNFLFGSGTSNERFRQCPHFILRSPLLMKRKT